MRKTPEMKADTLHRVEPYTLEACGSRQAWERVLKLDGEEGILIRRRLLSTVSSRKMFRVSVGRRAACRIFHGVELSARHGSSSSEADMWIVTRQPMVARSLLRRNRG